MPCIPGDFGCYLADAMTLLAPYILSIIIVAFAIFVLPKAGWKGVAAAAFVIFFVVWWWGLIPGLPALRTYFGF